MGISEVVTLAVIGHMVVLGTAVGMLMVPGYLSLLNFVICNTLFVKQESKLVTYVAGRVMSTVVYIMVRQEDRAKVCNVKVISSEECVPKHKLRHVRSTDAWSEIR